MREDGKTIFLLVFIQWLHVILIILMEASVLQDMGIEKEREKQGKIRDEGVVCTK